MGLIILIIIFSVLLPIIGGIFWFFFIYKVGKSVLKGIAQSMGEFQEMDVEGMLRTLVHLQQSGQFQLGHQYMGSLGEGPITSEIRGMAASEGISLDF